MGECEDHCFVEEEEPSGRRILGPCLLCGLAAGDALEALKAERDRLASTFRFIDESHGTEPSGEGER